MEQGSSKEQKKEKAMMVTWGESESDKESDVRKGPCLLVDDNQVSSSPKSALRLLIEEKMKS